MNMQGQRPSVIKLSDYISLTRIHFCSGTTREEVIDELIKVSQNDRKVTGVKAFKEALLKREGIMSTGIGYGVAIPHVKLPQIEEFFVTVGIHKKGVDWDSLDAQPVHLLFLIAGPDHLQERYLRILARLISVIKDPIRRSKIVTFNTRFEVYELLREF